MVYRKMFSMDAQPGTWGYAYDCSRRYRSRYYTN